jgi:DNA polymerase III epsilon subunit-like protein
MSQANLVSVDLETAGTAMGASPIIAIGACRVTPRWEEEWSALRELLAEARATEGPFTTEDLFYCEMRPDAWSTWDELSVQFHGLTREHLDVHGTDSRTALEAFGAWVRALAPEGTAHRLVSHNAAFDWAHLGGHFVRYGVDDPFDPFPACTKNIARGRFRAEGEDMSGQTGLRLHFKMPTHLGVHNALADALSQALLYLRLTTGS